MNLDFSKEMLLALYKETYLKNYNFANEKLMLGKIKKEHQNVMYMIYLIQKMLNRSDYDFIWYFNGPYSLKLHEELKEVDKIPRKINNFYISYQFQEWDSKKYIGCMNKNINRQSFYILKRQRLMKYFNFFESRILAENLPLITNFYLQYEVQDLASVLYLATTIHPSCDVEKIIDKYNILVDTKRSRQVIFKAWDYLDNLNLLYETQSRKLERY